MFFKLMSTGENLVFEKEDTLFIMYLSYIDVILLAL